MLLSRPRSGGLFRPAPAGLTAAVDSSAENRRASDRISVERAATLRWQQESEQSKLAVRVFDRSPAGVGLFLPQQLPVGLLASVRWEGGEAIQVVVRHCRQHGSEFVAGLMHLPVQQRSEDRQHRHEAGRLIWDDLLEGRVTLPVNLADVSLGGCRCHSTRSIPVPLVACLATTDWQYYGTTRYCVESESGYAIGIQIVRTELSVEPGLLLG